MTLTRREKFLIVFGLSAVLIAAYVFYFFIPYQQKSSDARTKYATTQSQIGILNAKAAGIETLKKEIASIEDGLTNQSASIPSGIDHARILLYLEKLTKGRSSDLKITATGETKIVDRFLTQLVTVEFSTTWPQLQKLLDDVKSNELYNRVAYLGIKYEPKQEMPPSEADATAENNANPTVKPVTDPNMISVHMEMLYYAFQPEEGKSPEPPLPPNAADRRNSLFP